ncbi:MAG: hypothetical protein WAM69_18765 [Candidatus Sulfotelmatobacter sp.]
MTRFLLFLLTAAALLIIAVTAQTSSKEQATGFWVIKIAADSPADESAVLDLHNPRTVTLCNDAFATYPFRYSIDGKHWHGLASGEGGGCFQSPPVRFVKLIRVPHSVAADEGNSAEVYATY